MEGAEGKRAAVASFQPNRVTCRGDFGNGDDANRSDGG